MSGTRMGSCPSPFRLGWPNPLSPPFRLRCSIRGGTGLCNRFPRARMAILGFAGARVTSEVFCLGSEYIRGFLPWLGRRSRKSAKARTSLRLKVPDRTTVRSKCRGFRFTFRFTVSTRPQDQERRKYGDFPNLVPPRMQHPRRNPTFPNVGELRFRV